MREEFVDDPFKLLFFDYTTAFDTTTHRLSWHTDGPLGTSVARRYGALRGWTLPELQAAVTEREQELVAKLTPESMEFELGMKVDPLDILAVDYLARGGRKWFAGTGPGAVTFKVFEKEMTDYHKKITGAKPDKAESNKWANVRQSAKAIKAIRQQLEKKIKNASVHRLNVFRCAYSVVFRHVTSQLKLHHEVPHATKDAQGMPVPGPRDWEYLREFLASRFHADRYFYQKYENKKRGKLVKRTVGKAPA